LGWVKPMIVRSHSKIRVDFIGPGEGLAAVSVLVDSKKILPERNRPNRNSLTSDLVGSVKDVDLMMMMRQKLDAQDQGRKMELAMMTSSASDAYNLVCMLHRTWDDGACNLIM